MKRRSLWLILAAGIVATTAARAQEPAYYYQGRHKVQVEVATDAVAVKAPGLTTATQAQMAARVQGAQVEFPDDLPGKAVIKAPGKGLSELKRQANQLKSTGQTGQAQAILRRPGAKGEAGSKVLTDGISFKLKPGTEVTAVAKKYGLVDVKAVGYAKGTYTARVDASDDLLLALKTANRMQESGDVEWAAPLVEDHKALRSAPNDPLFNNQWHLRNTGTNTISGTAGNDINVVPVWSFFTGDGVNIAIADDGLETTHPDLMANVRSDIDYDFNFLDDDPTPLPTHSHGTGCAGVAAGRWNNGVGITGVAPDAGLVGLRLLANVVSDEVQAAAMAWRYDDPNPHTNIAVHSNSWGPDDLGTVLDGPSPLTEAAMTAGVTEGRGGKGMVYVWAAGNGRGNHDNINKDGYANSPYVIAVGATTANGVNSWYSEPGAPMLVNAPSNNYANDDGIFTTDLAGTAGAAVGDYRPNFGGTSSAAPTVAGVVALMLEANPNLTYRDVMHILVETATKNDPLNTDWFRNGSGREFNHNYGFGRVDAEAAVNAAYTWQNVPPPAPVIEVPDNLAAPVAMPDFDGNGVLLDINVNASPDFVVEHAELEVDITHPYRGDVAILLQSPSGMISDLIITDQSKDSNDNYNNWRFRSVAHWGERAQGQWRVLFADLFSGDTGTVNSYTLRLRGYEAPPSSVDLWTLY